MQNESTLTPEQVRTLGDALLTVLFDLPIPIIREVVAAAGIDGWRIPFQSEQKGGQGSRAETIPVIQHLFGELSIDEKRRALPVLAERAIGEQKTSSAKADAERKVSQLMRQHGFHYSEGTFTPVDTGAPGSRPVRRGNTLEAAFSIYEIEAKVG